MNLQTFGVRPLFMVCVGLMSLSAWGVEDNAALIKQGEYVARAADCGACHRTVEKDGPKLAGGYAIESPMGKIIASNITPSKTHGIGNYTEQQLADALRKGINAQGQHLYPAMPYTSYQGMSDADIHALYVYLQHGVAPVDTPVAPTELAFPFNIRALMFGWNQLFLDKSGFEPRQAGDAQLGRGQYLVDALAHCGACHTPRNALMAEDNSRYLSGATLGGWVAPNITSDPASGVGRWSTDELALFLKNGHVTNKAQAGGGMAQAVENSLRYLSHDDVQAMAAYLKTVPAITTATDGLSDPRKVEPMDMVTLETGQGDQATLADAHESDGARLYNAACASCHGRDGQGTDDGFYPSLSQNSALTGSQANNLVMTIIEGISRKGADLEVNMPALGADLDDQQIAAIANYSLQRFGNPALSVTEQDVAKLRGGGDTPLLLKAMPYAMWGGGLALAGLLIAGLMGYVRRKRERQIQRKKDALTRRFHSR